MSPKRVGINGFGRIGRLAMRAAWDWPQFDFVHVNEIAGTIESAAHLLEFDSIHGRWERDIETETGGFSVDGEFISLSQQDGPGKPPWDELGVEVIIEEPGSSGPRKAFSHSSKRVSRKWFSQRQCGEPVITRSTSSLG